jgi:dTDP-4-dehydrorhamnose 3,5-epimerase
MGGLKAQATPLAGLFEIRTTKVGDARGQFSRLFCEEEFAGIRSGLHFSQINLSETRARGSIRGMHYQTRPAAEAKLIRCVRGRAFDVAVDVRVGSPTFLHWHAVELAEDNDLAVFIPEGFAHGFQTLSDDVHLLYLHTTAWTPACEAGLRHDDPRLAIDWPLPVSLISDKDRSYPLIDENFIGVEP